MRASQLFDRVDIRNQTSKAALRGRPKVYVFTILCEIPEFKPKPDRRRREKKEAPRTAPAVAGKPGTKKETNA